MHRFKALLFSLFIALLLAGCSVFVTTSISEDGSGMLSIYYKIPASYSCKDAQNNGTVPSDIPITQSTADDGDTLCRSSVQFQSLDELKRRLDATEIVSIRTLEIRNGQFIYDIDVFPRTQDTRFFDMAWILLLPGELNTSNARNIDNKGVMSWNLNINERNHIYADSVLPIPPTQVPASAKTLAAPSTSSSSTAPAFLGVGCIGLLGVVGVAGVFFYRRNASRKAQAHNSFFTERIRTPTNAMSSLHNNTSEVARTSSAEERLQKLQSLRDKGLIDEQEFASQKSKILENL